MVARLPERSGEPWQRGNRRLAAVFVVALVLIIGLYKWNDQRISEENAGREAKDRLCELREEIGADPASCAQVPAD